MDLQAVQGRLEKRLAELTRRDAALAKHLRGQDGRNDQDFEDRVAFTEMDEVIEQLDDNARTEMVDIQAALKRIQAGEYGICESCGGDIPEKRLEILPHARLCVSCQE
ncbi:MAG: TraR/DksA family transcriptional regulator [Alphaproteobacteria bacterium]|nr:TraR/DksA family transcriptional regulator [Alphaproteobacteria bacterium]